MPRALSHFGQHGPRQLVNQSMIDPYSFLYLHLNHPVFTSLQADPGLGTPSLAMAGSLILPHSLSPDAPCVYDLTSVQLLSMCSFAVLYC